MVAKAWTKEEDELLQNWTGTYAELAEKLGRTPNGVRNRYRRLRDTGRVEAHDAPVAVPWTAEEDGELLAWDGSLQGLADKLGRSLGSVKARRERLSKLTMPRLKAIHVSTTDAEKAKKKPKPADDFKDYPIWHNWPPELHITVTPNWNITDIAEHAKQRAEIGDLVYGHAPHVRKHAIEMLQQMSNDEQLELVTLLGIPARSKARHERMAALLANEFLVEELYNY